LVIRDSNSSDQPSISEVSIESMAIGGLHDEGLFRAVTQFLKKRAWIILVSLAIGYLAGVLVNRISAKLYTAKASIDIQSQDVSSQFRLQQMPGFEDADTGERMDTEIEILRSRNLALETIKALHLESNPDFAPLKNGRPNDLSSPEVREDLVAYFHSAVAIARLGHTNIVQIMVTSKNPQLASLIANAIIDTYIEHSFRENFAATAKISAWLDQKLNGLKTNLERSEEHILDLQKDLGVYGIGQGQGNSVVAANLEELNKQYADAEVDRLLKESRLQEMKESSPDVIDAATANTDAALLVDKQRLAQLNDEYTQLVQTYGSAHPRVRTMKAQIEELQRALTREEATLVARTQKEFETAATNESKLLGALTKQEEEAYGNGEKAVQYELARSQYEADRLLYDGMQERLEEASIMSGLHSTAIHTVDSADIPIWPSYPRTRVNIAFSTSIGLGFGFALALLLEAMDTNLKTITEIEQSLQLPLLAAIPQVESDHLLPSKFKEHAILPSVSSWSKVAEALRGMRTSIMLSSPGAPPKVILFVSTRPTEGKTSIASLMAITFGLNGKKVLLIDGDLRRPAIHLRFRIGKGLSLSSVLSGKASLHEAVVEWPEMPNLHILTSGPVPPLPSELLGSKEMHDLLTQARSEYDFVLMDTPPVLAVTDASLLGRQADAAVLIVRYGAVQKDVARRCIDVLERAGTHLLGIVVNAVDYTSPEYADYYGRKYYEYYGPRDPE
jgi:succinoglycan biosynthesis transport protein ExoP